MKSVQKIAIGLASAVVVGGITILGLRKKKEKENLNQNQAHSTNDSDDNYQTPLQSLENNQSQFNSLDNINPTTNQNIPNNVNYHQKGTRHK